MNNSYKQDTNFDENIDLSVFFYILWAKKFLIIFITSIISISSILFALGLPDIYKSQALLMPRENNMNSGMLSNYSGIASIAGISLPKDTSSKSKESIARIRSFEFFSNHFLPRINLEDLFAVEDWNQSNNTLSYDPKIFNSKLNQWTREVELPKLKKPSNQEAYAIYNEIMEISENSKTSFVSLSVKHHSPFIAEKWTSIIVDEIHKNMRERDKIQATNSIKFLNEQASKVNYEEVRNTIRLLQEEQMKKLMIIDSSEEYIYVLLEPPFASENKYEPKRSQIVILATLIGFILSLITALAVHFRNASKDNNS